jgi:5'-3' exonuclease
MGIPSYYKKLIDTVHGLVLRRHPEEIVDWLFMDFNCLIYHCLYQKDMPDYPGIAEQESWEADFMERIVQYALHVIRQVQPAVGVYLAIDGVVPMAKMRQQRLRRFKSVWLSTHTTDTRSKWDTNAITPGTVFMKKLRLRLERMMKDHNTWRFSSSDEPGEGEHKIMAQWRTGDYQGNMAVYGLDADLVVLSLLGRATCPSIDNVWLFREEMQAGAIAYEDGVVCFEWFSIHALSEWLSSAYLLEDKQKFILQYCFAMSILGNDFLPSSLGLKIREDGHAELLAVLHSLMEQGKHLICVESHEIVVTGLCALFTTLAGTEAIRIQKYISKKQSLAHHTGDLLLLGENNWPLHHVEESFLMEERQLSPQWQEKYMSSFLGHTYDKRGKQEVCKEYLYGIQWIWSYYVGRDKDVCFNWYYPSSVPPLWEWIRDFLMANPLPSFPDTVYVSANDIRPVEQLALVLPLESWDLIPSSKEKQLPLIAPHLYPTQFSFDSVGKRFFWECESMIPIPSIIEVKEMIRSFS